MPNNNLALARIYVRLCRHLDILSSFHDSVNPHLKSFIDDLNPSVGNGPEKQSVERMILSGPF
jgi:hypothetical protein